MKVSAFPVLGVRKRKRARIHVLVGSVVDHSQCTAVEGKGTREVKSEDADEGETPYSVIFKAVFLENGPPEVFSNLVPGLLQEV